MTAVVALIVGVLAGVVLARSAHRCPPGRPRMVDPGWAPATSRPERPTPRRPCHHRAADDRAAADDHHNEGDPMTPDRPSEQQPTHEDVMLERLNSLPDFNITLNGPFHPEGAHCCDTCTAINLPPEPDNGTWIASARGQDHLLWHRDDNEGHFDPDMPHQRHWWDHAANEWITWPEVVARGGHPDQAFYIGKVAPRDH